MIGDISFCNIMTHDLRIYCIKTNPITIIPDSLNSGLTTYFVVSKNSLFFIDQLPLVGWRKTYLHGNSDPNDTIIHDLAVNLNQ